MKILILVLLIIKLLNKMQIIDGFIKPCNASVHTVRKVAMCPSSNVSYKKAAMKKNCLSLTADARKCRSFEYHCVLSDNRKYAIEVCAPSINIVGQVCAKFSTNHRSIIRIHDFDCTECPYSYNSTLAFQYAQCYANITLPFTIGKSQRNMISENNTHGVIAALGSIAGLLFISLVIILILIGFFWRKKREQNEGSALPLITKIVTDNNQEYKNNESPAIVNGEPLSPNQQSSTKKGFVENKLYTKRDAGLTFAQLTNRLADKFPHQELQRLKLLLQASGKVGNLDKLKAANSASECFSLLLDEYLFSQYDVVFMQFLCKEMCCIELYTDCIAYALEQKALCYYENTSDCDGHDNVKFHVKGDLQNYTKEQIQDIVHVVADILHCKEEDIGIQGLQKSQSFILILSIKKDLMWKLSDINEADLLKFDRLNIDYLIVRERLILLESSRGNAEKKSYNNQDVGIEFAKLTNYLAGHLLAEKIHDLKSVIMSSGKVKNVASLQAADSALGCLAILLDEKLFTQNDVTFMQCICKQIHNVELYKKCTEYAKTQGSLCHTEKPSGNRFNDCQPNVKENTTGSYQELFSRNVEIINDEVECPSGMDKISMEQLDKGLQILLAGCNTKDYIKFAVKEQSDLTGTNVVDDFHKLVYGVHILYKLTECSMKPVLSFTESLSALSSMIQKIGLNLKSAAAPVEEDSIFVALQRYQDSDLTGEAVGLVDLLFTINAYFGKINEQDHESVVNRLEDKFPTNDIVRFMGKLKAKTHELLTTSDPHSARRASVYINLYFRLANLRTLVLWQVFCIKQQRGFDQLSTQGVLAMINESQKSDMEVVRYVTETSFQKAVFHTIFHPTENENFMHFICIQRIKIPSLGHDKKFCRRKHFIRSSKLPNIRFEMMSPKTDFICGSQNTSFACKFYLEPVRNRKLDGIFYMRSVKWSDSYVSMDKDGKCVSVSGKPESEGQWKVVLLGNEGPQPQFLFSTLKWPCKFLFLKAYWKHFSIEGTENFKASKEYCLWEILDGS